GRDREEAAVDTAGARLVRRPGCTRARDRAVCALDDGGECGHGIGEDAPGVEATGERPHPLDAATSEEQRHPGARGLVGSGAIERDVTLTRDLLVSELQLFRRGVKRSVKGLGLV